MYVCKEVGTGYRLRNVREKLRGGKDVEEGGESQDSRPQEA